MLHKVMIHNTYVYNLLVTFFSNYFYIILWYKPKNKICIIFDCDIYYAHM